MITLRRITVVILAGMLAALVSLGSYALAARAQMPARSTEASYPMPTVVEQDTLQEAYPPPAPPVPQTEAYPYLAPPNIGVQIPSPPIVEEQHAMQPNLLVTLITYAARGLTIVFSLLGLVLVSLGLVYAAIAMGKGDLLHTALRLYRAYAVTLLAIAAPLIILFGMLQLLTLGSSEFATFINGLQALVIGSVVAGALTFASSRIYLRQPVTLLRAYRFGVGKAFSLLGVIVLQALIITLPIIALIVLINLVSVVVPIARILILFLMIPFIFFVLTKYSVAIPALINEPISALESLDRSARLTEGMFWPTLGVVLATGIVTFLIAELPALALTYLAPAGDTSIARILLAQIGLIIVMPFHYTVYTLLYYDLRVRQGLSELAASTAYVPPYASSAASAPMGTVAAEGVGRGGQVRLRE